MANVSRSIESYCLSVNIIHHFREETTKIEEIREKEGKEAVCVSGLVKGGGGGGGGQRIEMVQG